MNRARLQRELAVVTLLAGLYFVAGKLGLKLAFFNPSATAVWPPTGIALAAFLILGYRVWPGIFIGAFLANLTTAGTAATSVGIALGNTLEGLTGAYLVNRFAQGRKAFDRAQDFFKYVILAALTSTMVSATAGVTSLTLGGFARLSDFGSIWLTWWLGDAVGDLVLAPLLLLWYGNLRPTLGWNRLRILEVGSLLLGTFAVGRFVFGGLLPFARSDYPLEFVCIPFLIWAAFRFDQRTAALLLVLLSGIAIRGTLHGFGPFVRESKNESLLLLQAFMGVCAVLTLALAAIVSEHKRTKEELERLAGSDPLTGLSNHRRFIGALEEEIRRSRRTSRPFAVLLMDLDNLKGINDRYGHLTGNRALCRLANVLHSRCRAVDLPARFGGDEFALVLPETEESTAGQALHRICESLASDEEKPPLSVSVGMAVYPHHGETAEKLLRVADLKLYQMKAIGRKPEVAATPKEQKNRQRRSPRTLWRTPVIVKWSVQGGLSVREHAETEVVNAHGALLRLGTLLSVGKSIELSRPQTSEFQTARVVWNRNETESKPRVGIELNTPSETFWGVYVPIRNTGSTG